MAKKAKKNRPSTSSPFMQFGNELVGPGERKRIDLEVATLYDYTKINIPIEVIRGKEEGPTLFISAAVHGDEINGIEIIKRILQSSKLARIKGTLICIPVVNTFGFNNLSRYLPDRRDLNRCFPGSARGSLGSRLAHLFMKEIVSKCSHGIDLHTGAIHRSNIPQIRASLDNEEVKQLANDFGVPIIINSSLRDGSLREAARKKRVKVLLFEGGEALRFEEDVIKAGLKGCFSLMKNIGMLPQKEKIKKKKRVKKKSTYVAQSSHWVRAPHSGSVKQIKTLGDEVQAGEIIAVISDTFGNNPYNVRAKSSGIIIGMSTIPLVNKGDAMVHIALFSDSSKVSDLLQTDDEEII